MDLERLRDRATSEICRTIPAGVPDAAKARIADIVGAALRDATGVVHDRSREAVIFCCGPEADLAHKIQHRLDQQRDMLIANLMAMR